MLKLSKLVRVKRALAPHKVFIRSAIILKEDLWSLNSFITRNNLPKLNFTSFQGSFLRKFNVRGLMNLKKMANSENKNYFHYHFFANERSTLFFV